MSGACQLAWDIQPTSTKIDTTITGAPYDPTGGALGTCLTGSATCDVTVKAIDANGNTITSINGGTVALASTGTFAGTKATFSNGKAVFTNLAAGSTTGSGFTLTASSAGYLDSPPSNAFNITLTGEPCSGSGCPSFTTKFGNTTQLDASAAGGFTFIGIDQSSIPDAVTQPGGGCQYFQSLGAAVVTESDGRTGGGGALLFTYSIANNLIKQSPNNGQPFVPICAGAVRLDPSGNPTFCTPGTMGWLGDALDPVTHTFNGLQAPSLCEPDGMYWGILGTYQDKAIDPATNPTVTGWKSSSAFRSYFITVPFPWDINMGG